MGLTLRSLVVWFCPISIQGDSDSALLGGFELFSIEFGSVRMGEDDVMSDDPGFFCA